MQAIVGKANLIQTLKLELKKYKDLKPTSVATTTLPMQTPPIPAPQVSRPETLLQEITETIQRI